MKCPECGTSNSASFVYCMECGYELPENVSEAKESFDKTKYMPPAPPQSTELKLPDPINLPIPIPLPPQPSQISTGTGSSSIKSPVSSEKHSDIPQRNMYGSQHSSAIGIWGPFAGYGTRRRHVGWLLDNQGDQAGKLAQQVDIIFRGRKIPQARQHRMFLTGKGLMVESRSYHIIRRGLASTGLYISQFGNDLFISLVSYLKPPISYFRVLLLLLMGLFGFFFNFSYSEAMQNAVGGFNLLGGGSIDIEALISLICIVGPLGVINNIALLIFAIYSIYKLLADKDLLAGLRTTPNEFNEDDLMAMEKAVESTVRMAMDDVGLNFNDLKPVAVELRGRII